MTLPLHREAVQGSVQSLPLHREAGQGSVQSLPLNREAVQGSVQSPGPSLYYVAIDLYTPGSGGL